MKARRYTAAMATLTIAIGSAQPIAAAADVGACTVNLWSTPWETVAFPNGETYESVTLNPLGMSTSVVMPDAVPSNLNIWCLPDASTYMQREQELRGFMGVSRLGVAVIGDESALFRRGDYLLSLKWRRGDVVGDLSFENDVPLDEAEGLAMAFDAILPR